jgi:hypothetical protein
MLSVMMFKLIIFSDQLPHHVARSEEPLELQ